MKMIPANRLETYRLRTHRQLPDQQVKNRDEAVEFANERGFVYFWPIKNIVLPSLWAAVAGNRPVADAHDDPGHVTWGWKDSLLGQRVWYYAKVLRKRATIIAMDIAPFFYALSENYGSPEEDYLTIYEQGRMTLEAKTVYECLLDKGPMDTVALRREAHMTSKESDARFNRALTDLQTDFKVVPIDVADAGAWHYAFAYDIVARHYPEIPARAHEISEREARQTLASLYLKSVGAAQVKDIVKLFGWRVPNAQGALDRLAQAGEAVKAELEGQRGEFYATLELLE
jgi:hypothetical protein